MDITDIAKALGSRGGIKTKQTHSKDDYRKWQKKSVEARLKKRVIQFDTVEAKLPT